jgi:predicted N-acetyltransferase YhbS
MDLTFAAMQASHLPDAAQLSRAAGWPHRTEDWALVHGISNGVVALADNKLVATALATSFGPVAMANLIIVDSSLRSRGLGREITQRAMATLDSACWQLVATQNGLPLYEKLGFRPLGEIAQHQGEISELSPIGPAIWGSAEDLPAIIELDYQALQMNRHRLFHALSSQARFAVIRGADSAVSGFAVLREFGRGRVIGPVVASNLDEAKSLLSLALAEHPGELLRVDTETSTGLGAWLTQSGLAKIASGVLMQAGGLSVPCDAPADSLPRRFALTSQALG